jgi:hypothetical protein
MKLLAGNSKLFEQLEAEEQEISKVSFAVVEFV